MNEHEHCPACRAAHEIRQHRDDAYPAWGERRGVLNFAAIVASHCCPAWTPTEAGEPE